MIQERSKAELGTVTASIYHSRSPVIDYHPETKTRQLYLVRGSGARE